MSYRFVIGVAGSGKTTKAIDYLLEKSSKDKSKTYLYIVPEQFTLQTQRALVEKSPGHSVLDIDILSFNRLAFRVFKELGEDSLTILEEVGKNLILRKLAGENKDSLKVMGEKYKNMYYIEEIKSVISEMMQYRVSYTALNDISDKLSGNNLLSAKLADISLLYEKFLSYIEGDYVTAETMLEKLCDIIGDCKFLENSTIVFDGFTGFTPIQNEIVKKLMQMSEEILFIVTLPPQQFKFVSIKQEELFYMSKTYISRIRDASYAFKIKEEEAFVLDGERRASVCEIYEANNPKAELEFAAGLIRNLCKEGYRYKDIAIAAGDLDVYAPYMKDVFSRYKLPVFFDKTESIGVHPLISLIKNATKIINYDFTPVNIIAFVKNKISGIEMDAKDEFEFYLNASGIKRYSYYKNDFVKRPYNISDDELARINDVRNRLLEILSPLLSYVNNSEKEFSVHEMSCSFYEFLRGLDYIDDSKDGELIDVYDLVIAGLEKTEGLLSEERMSFSEYTDILLSGIAASKLKQLPKSRDMVIFGDTIRTRLDGVKVLIVLGVNDGDLPPASGNKSILTEGEREILSALNVNLSETVREKQFAGLFYMYLLEHYPSEKLYLTYSLLSMDGEAKRPSYIVHSIKKEYKACIQRAKLLSNTEESLFYNLIGLLKKYRLEELSEDESRLLFSYLELAKKMNPKRLDAITDNVFYKYRKDILSTEILRAIDGYEIRGAVSRLESYSKCAYAYYLKYILGLNDTPKHGMESVDYGNVYHECLFEYFMYLKENNVDIGDMDETTRDKIVEKSVISAFEKIENTGDYSGGLHKYIKDKTADTLKLNINVLTDHIKKSGFVPSSLEADLRTISSAEDLLYELENGCKLRLGGKIDRIDTFSEGDSVYIKVIDYKSGHESFSYGKLNSGIQIQLLYYLSIKTKSEMRANPKKEIVPAAAFYYRIDDPTTEDSNALFKEDAFKKIQKEFVPKGLIADDKNVLFLLDNELKEKMGQGSYTSDIVDIKINKDGAVAKNDFLLKKDDVNILLDIVEKKVKEIATDISQGKIEKRPYQIGAQENACKFCSYHGICSFGKINGEDKYKKVETIKSFMELKSKNGL